MVNGLFIIKIRYLGYILFGVKFLLENLLFFFKIYEDWSGRCSSWCKCSKTEKMKCHKLQCLVDMHCEALHTTVGMLKNICIFFYIHNLYLL